MTNRQTWHSRFGWCVRRLALIGLAGWISCTDLASAGTHYVVKGNAGALSPFTNWMSAASNIQQAIDDTNCIAFDTVLVSNGVYNTGGQLVGSYSNRVAVTKVITVTALSTNWSDTVIEGAPDPVSGEQGPAAIRGVYLTNGAALIGFTVTNGYTLDNGAGGGIYCAGNNSVVSNCLIVNNRATYGGGFYGGTIANCLIVTNTAINIATNALDTGYGGGGAGWGAGIAVTIRNCVFANNFGRDNGGGFYGNNARISDSMFVSNRASSIYSSSKGGGIGSGDGTSIASNCVVIYNWAYYSGGGVYNLKIYGSVIAKNATINNIVTTAIVGGYWGAGPVVNCTIAGNSAHPNNTAGVSGSTYATNCIIQFNGSAISNYNSTVTLSYCSTWPMPPSGSGNITNDPAFADFSGGNYRLTPNSPCINMGTNQGWMWSACDLDGHRRIIEDTIDIGAYEFLHQGSIFKIR